MTFDYQSFGNSLDTSLLMTAGLLAAAGRGLRRFLDLPTRAPRFNAWLRWLWVPGIALFGLQAALRVRWSQADDTYVLAALGLIGYVLYHLRGYRPARSLLLAGGPIALALAAELVLEVAAPTLAKRYDDPLGSAQFFALVWLLVFVSIARREKRTLAAEAETRAAAEARKAELEALVSERTAALRQQTAELELALTHLRATQAQLIQSEKMASLGELTAGIAHEIQNPLNFVTNFSEVSTELIDELKTAQAAGDAEEVSALADDLAQNLTKITEHGRRAASIVRGMLEHSRASTGERAPTDLNALADEYLRLAYHGLRAKDKTFNAHLAPTLDPALPKLSVAAGDIGRVLLNLFTNAFYAVRQRQQRGEAGYQPTVSVRTRTLPGGGAEIRVRDNGTGIPDSVKAKIFQPFFTTKPTGEGTGLGLSLSFDIISKAHGGTLAVESVEGESTEFIITLPA